MRKGEATRQRIIAKAAPIFNRRGLSGSSMQDVMDATGLEKGGLYRHFASKEELAAEAFRYSLDRVIQVRTDNLADVSGSIDKLRYLIERFVEAPASVPGGCPLMNTAIESDDGNPVLRKLAQDGIEAWRNRLCEIIDEGKRRREIRASTTSRRVANTIIASLEGALMISRLEGDRVALRDAQASLQLVLDEIARRSH